MDRFSLRRRKKALAKWFEQRIKKQKKAHVENTRYSHFCIRLPLAIEVPKSRLDIKAFADSHSFGTALTFKGYQRLGSGAYSTVYAKPKSTKVIKIVHTPDGWIDYIKWASDKGYAGRFAPQVHSYKWIKSDNPYGGFGVAVMERLDKTVIMADMNDDVHVVNHLFSRAMYEGKLAHKLLEQVVPGLPEFGIKLRETFKGALDLHGQNVMLRADGSFVVTDPVAAREVKITHMRLRAKDLTPLASATIH